MENKECPETREDPTYQEIQTQSQLTVKTYFLILVQLQSQHLGSGGGGQPLLQFELEASLGYKRPFLTNNNKKQMKEMEVKT